MGMDVYGKSGNYFRANVWSWRPIGQMLHNVLTGADELQDIKKEKEESLSWIQHNDGFSLTGSQARRVAEAFRSEDVQIVIRHTFDMYALVKENVKGQRIEWLNEDGETRYKMVYQPELGTAEDLELMNRFKAINDQVYPPLGDDDWEDLKEHMFMYNVFPDHWEEFIEFMEASDGFEIW